MTATSNSIERYLRDVGKALPCVRRTRRAMMEGLRQELAEFAESAPDAPFETLCEMFGDPETAASQLLDGVDEAELRRTRNKKRVLIGVCIAACAAIAVFFYVQWYTAQQIISEGGFTVVIHEPKQVSSDEGTIEEE